VSDQTKAALELALEAHIADECDGDMTGAWVFLAETTTADEMDMSQSVFYIETRNHQSRFMTDGLLHSALARDGWGDDE
jgi:hypothetical protein